VGHIQKVGLRDSALDGCTLVAQCLVVPAKTVFAYHLSNVRSISNAVQKVCVTILVGRR
jgi:hypothetical protein